MREEKEKRSRVTRRSGTRIGNADNENTRHAPGEQHRRYEGERREYDERRRAEGAPRRERRFERDYDEFGYAAEDERRARERRREEYEQGERHAPNREQEHREQERREQEHHEHRPHGDERRRPEEKERREQPHLHHAGNPNRTVHQLMPYALFCMALFSALSFILRDLLPGTNATGSFGSFLANFLCGLFGVIGYIIPLFMLVLALRWRRFVVRGTLIKKLLLSTTFVLLLSGIVHVFKENRGMRQILDTTPNTLYYNGMAQTGGGFFGGFFGEWMGKILNLPGTCILAIPLLLIVAIYMLGHTPFGLWERAARRYRAAAERREARRAEKYDGVEEPQRYKEPQHEPKAEKAAPPPEENEPQVGWRQPRPILGFDDEPKLEHFSFNDEEDEPVRRPTRRTPEPSVQASAPAPAPVYNESVVDIPDDEPEEAVYAAEQEARRAAAAAAPTPDPTEVLRAAAAATAAPEGAAYAAQPAQAAAPEPARVYPTVQPTQGTAATTSTEKKEESHVYAPFALPVRPFPEKEQHEPVAPAVHTAPVAAPAEAIKPFAQQPVKEVPPARRGEEVLGANRPADFDRISYVDQTPPEKEQPVAQKPAAQSPYAAMGTPVTPFSVAQKPAEPDERPAAPKKEEPLFAPFAPSVTKPQSSFVFDTADDEPEDEDEMILPEEEKKEQPLATREAERPQSSFGFVSDVAEEEKDEDEDIFAKLAATVNAAPEKPAEGEEDKPAADSEFDAAARELAALLADEKEEPAPVNEPEPEPIPTWTPPPSWTPPRAVAVKAERVAPEPKPEPEPEPPMREYQHPTVDLLNEDTVRKNTDHSEEIAEKIEILRSTLESFHIRVKEQVDCSRGPTITRYELRPEVGVSVRSVMNRIDDISLNLAAPVRIEAPIPGKPAIGVEVPNAVRETVFMRTMLESEAFKNSKKPLDIPLGLGIGGDVQMCNLASMPHLLVAGTTGSGKSVCINTILLGLIYKCSPADLRLILIDPKQIEFAPYEHIPHLYMPIVTDMQRAAGALACAVQEMERRYSLIRDVGVRDIDSYNEAVKNDPDREHLPRIVIVIDEFADLKMSCANNDPENFTCRLAQKARAAGIHLIIGTQRPSVDVITGKLKNNIPSRIAFTVMQQVDSRTILDMNGAESLTGKGDMLYMPVGSPKPARVQGAFVSDGELERVVNYVRKNNDPVRYNQAFMDQIEAEMARAAGNGKKDDFDGDDDGADGEDPKFIEAVELAVETQKVATSLLQRRLGVGYGRAAKIIDRMEELGLVSEAEGNKPRKLLPAAQGYLNHMRTLSGEDADDYDEFS